MHTADLLLQSLEQHGWGFSDHILSPVVVENLGTEAAQFWNSGKFHSAHVGRGFSKSVHSEIRGDSICWLEPQTLGSEALSAATTFLAWAEAFRQLLNERYYLGLRSEEFHFARYPSGKGYVKHLDQHRDCLDRKISLVLYLNQNWLAQDGGELVLYSPADPALSIQKILPAFGRLVIFRSDLVPHEVLPCFQTRWSLTGWFRSEVQSPL